MLLFGWNKVNDFFLWTKIIPHQWHCAALVVGVLFCTRDVDNALKGNYLCWFRGGSTPPPPLQKEKHCVCVSFILERIFFLQRRRRRRRSSSWDIFTAPPTIMLWEMVQFLSFRVGENPKWEVLRYYFGVKKSNSVATRIKGVFPFSFMIVSWSHGESCVEMRWRRRSWQETLRRRLLWSIYWDLQSMSGA